MITSMTDHRSHEPTVSGRDQKVLVVRELPAADRPSSVSRRLYMTKRGRASDVGVDLETPLRIPADELGKCNQAGAAP